MIDVASLTNLLAVQVGNDAGQTPVESVGVDGTPPSELPVAEQNSVLLIALPVILLVVGAITYVVKRPAPGSEPKGVNGGLVLMGVGGFLTLAVLVFLMLAQ